MIVSVDETNLSQAATIHSISWRESHRSFCAPDFVEKHTPKRQQEYLQNKMNNAARIYMLVDEEPVGIVSVTKSMIEDLYVLPDRQNKGYGTALLEYATSQCTETPTLWILENNSEAKRFYNKRGFKETGRRATIDKGLDEIELALTAVYPTKYINDLRREARENEERIAIGEQAVFDSVDDLFASLEK